MASTPNRVYILFAPDGQIISTYTNKKVLYDAIIAQRYYKLKEWMRYESFSQVINWNGSCFWATTKGDLKVYQSSVNDAIA